MLINNQHFFLLIPLYCHPELSEGSCLVRQIFWIFLLQVEVLIAALRAIPIIDGITFLQSQGDNNKALEYMYKILKLYEEGKDKHGLSESLNNLAVIYDKQGDIKKALEYHFRSLKIREETNDKRGMGVSFDNIGNVYENNGENYVAELSAANDALKLVAYYDDQKGQIKLNRVAGTPTTGRVFELWLIEGKNPPISLGVLPTAQTGTLTLKASLKAKLSGATLAISDEPTGGSPTGQPTGAVLATGNIHAI